MQGAVKEYDAKKRSALRNALPDAYHATEYVKGMIALEPRDDTATFQISAKTLAMMDAAVQNVKDGIVSDKIDVPPAPRSINADLMTDDELRAAIREGIDDASMGRARDAREAFAEFGVSWR